MPTKLKLIPVLLAPLALTACETGFRDPEGKISTFGEANRQTMMAQVVDPDPQYAEPAEASAQKAAQAIERYRKDAVKKPDRVRASSAGSGSGGSN